MTQKKRILSLSIISSLFLFTFFVSHADAKTLYVDPNGNDSTTYANNSSSAPWRTIGRASWGSTNREARNSAEAAKAGDVVQVNSGTYSGVGTGSRNEIYYYQENSGTVGNPITFKANGTVTLTQTGTGAMIGSYGRNYITWDGFTIDEANARSAGDTGPTTVFDCTGCVLQNLNLTGNGTDFGRLDNHTGIRIEGSRSVTVRNTKITNVYTAHNPNNGACIQTYASYGLTIENNELSNCGSGIFLKGGPWPAGSGPTISSYIRNNYIHDIGESARGGSAIIAHAGAPYTAQNPVYIYKNVIKNVTEAGFRLWLFSDTEVGNNPQYVKFANNTIDHAGYGIHVSSPLSISLGHTFWNNIVTNSGSAIAYNDVQGNIVENRVDFEHNLYFNNPIFAEIGNGTRYTLPTWKSTYGHDSSSPASITSDPMFVSSTDYHLQSGSPARTLGVDIYDLNSNGSNSDIVPAGAYMTGSEVIGLDGGAALPPPPPPTVVTDTTAPIVSLSSPIGTVSGTVSVTASASDNVGVAGVQFKLNGANLGVEDTSAPYATTWNTTTSINGTYTLTATARDTSGNTTTSAGVVVTVNNTVTVPSSTRFAVGQRVQASANINVRSVASATGLLLGTQSTGALGTIVSGGTSVDGFYWWNVNYDSGVDGYSVEDYLVTYNNPTTGWTFCANENQLCSFSGTKEVRFGVDPTYVTGVYTDGVNCSYNVFGDPALNMVKTCSYRDTVVTPPVETLPLAPASLSASPTGTSQIDLVWTDSSTNETGFRVERKTGLSGTYSEVATVASNTTMYQSTSLTDTTQYYFRVRSYNSVGNSGYSPEASAVTATPIVVTPPATTTDSNVISIGDRIQVVSKTNVRKTPGGSRVGYQYRGVQGIVTEGPTQYSGYPWYKVNFESGVDGWVRGDLVIKMKLAFMTREEIQNYVANIYLLIKQLQDQLEKIKGN